MKDGVEMPAIEGHTVGMTRDNCMAYCINERRNEPSGRYTYFGG